MKPSEGAGSSADCESVSAIEEDLRRLAVVETDPETARSDDPTTSQPGLELQDLNEYANLDETKGNVGLEMLFDLSNTSELANNS